jgi:hypothetical protein
MKSYIEWKTEIENNLQTHKSFFQVNLKMTIETANKLKSYFSENGYDVETRMCNTCSGILVKSYDIMITKKK